MTTQARHFAEIAARVGGVDPDDRQAVVRWFAEELPQLPTGEVDEILEQLLAAQGGAREPGRLSDAPASRGSAALPRLSESPRATPPWFALGVGRRLLAALRSGSR